MTLVLLNSRNREVFSGTIETSDKSRDWATWKFENGGGNGPRANMYRSAAVVCIDVVSAKPAGPMAGLFRQHVLSNRSEWPFSAIAERFE